MKSIQHTVATLVTVSLLVAGATAHATVVTNTSPTFSIGLGYTATGWNSSEIAPGTNSPAIQSSFSFVPSVVSGFNSGSGPTFPNRVLTDGGGVSYSGNANAGGIQFTNTITASWLGGTPPDASATPDYQIRLNITSLRLRVASWDGSGNPFGFIELAPGPAGSSPTISDTPTAGNNNTETASTYTQLVWNAGGYTVSGTNISRTFMMVSPTPIDLQLDGYEVFGNVQLIYNLIPEPSILLLFIAGGGLLAWRRERLKSSS